MQCILILQLDSVLKLSKTKYLG